MLAHERAARRATDERYVDAVDQLLIASAAINGGFDSVMFALDATDPTLLVTATDKVDRAIDGWQAASMSMEVRIRGANPVIPLMHEADKAVQAFREQILGKPTITGLTSIHDRFVEKVNALTQEAQRQIGAATPGMPASATT
jgi:hypothetical protein